MNKTFASLLAPVTLLEWGGILLYFHWSGRINAFLHPSFRPQVFGAGALLVICGIILLLTRNVQTVGEWNTVDNSSDPTRFSVRASWFFPIMLLLPLGIAAAFTRDAFGSNILTTRGVVDSAAGLPALADKYAKLLQSAPPQAVEPALPGADSAGGFSTPGTDASSIEDFFKPNGQGNISLNVADLLYATEDPSLRSPFEGKSAELVGQFMPAKTGNPTGNRFKLVRMFMTCCASDVQPISILIDPEVPLPEKINDMVWIKVTGRVTFPLENGRVTTVIVARRVEVTDPPEETMLF